MTNTASDDNHDAPEDPRHGLSGVIARVSDLIEATEALPAGTTAKPTPCDEYSVADLMDHMVMVIRRIVAIGNGDHWSTIEEVPLGSGWAKAFTAEAEQVGVAWDDPAKLTAVYEVPWGALPGAPLLFTYTAELATHGWDLSTATGQPFTVEDELLGGALMAAKMIPAEGRDTPEVPFDPVVDPGPDAPVLLKVAGWGGRQVLA